MADTEYIRLARPRRRSGFLSSTSTRSGLWLGKDHLLCVETNGYTETYKRFYFRDIQAFTLRRTNGFLVANAILIPGVLLFAGLVFFVDDQAGRIVLWCIAALLGIPLLVNLVRGPTSVCRIRTAVQEEEIPALANIRKTNDVMARIRPLIAEAQGLVAREEIPVRMRELAAQSQPRLIVDNPNLPPRMVS